MSNRRATERERALLAATAPPNRYADHRIAALRQMLAGHEKHLADLEQDRARTEAALDTIRKQLDAQIGEAR